MIDGTPAAWLLAGQACEAAYAQSGDGLSLLFSSADEYYTTDEGCQDLYSDYDSHGKLTGIETRTQPLSWAAPLKLPINLPPAVAPRTPDRLPPWCLISLHPTRALVAEARRAH
ncbi:hypothetical protein WJX72_005423 [[Myrmecia] bisecta]|uniref:Uncharacterized protein n=1 Tax=[Myrmecia] bisecta TaxID=41462 RepID=A0AAW1Q406_9CHLO